MKASHCMLVVAVCLCGILAPLLPGCSTGGGVGGGKISPELQRRANVLLFEELHGMDDQTFVDRLENAKTQKELFKLYLRVVVRGGVKPRFTKDIERIFWSSCLTANNAMGLKILNCCMTGDSEVRTAFENRWTQQCWMDYKRAKGKLDLEQVFISAPNGSDVQRTVLRKLEGLSKGGKN